MEKNSYVNKNIYDISYSMKKARWQFIRNIVLFVLLFFVSLNLVLQFCVSPVKQKSRSMEPTIKSNSLSLTTPLALYSGENIRRGEIVLIEHPQIKQIPFSKKIVNVICRALTLKKAPKEEKAFLSRIAALPGDTIFMKDFVLYIMPKEEHFFYTEHELSQIPYNIDIRVPPAGWNTQIGVRGNFEKITLGTGEYFVLADNRLSSMDSRIFGTVNEKNIKRKVLMTYFPLNAFRLFRSKIKK